MFCEHVTEPSQDPALTCTLPPLPEQGGPGPVQNGVVVGLLVGESVGVMVGILVGEKVGLADGDAVGGAVGRLDVG